MFDPVVLVHVDEEIVTDGSSSSEPLAAKLLPTDEMREPEEDSVIPPVTEFVEKAPAPPDPTMVLPDITKKRLLIVDGAGERMKAAVPLRAEMTVVPDTETVAAAIVPSTPKP
jgi:hypothetical protein